MTQDPGAIPPDPNPLPPAPAVLAAPGYGAALTPAWGARPPGLVVDPGSGLLLPEGTQLAGIGRRIGAWFLAFPLAIVTLFIGYLIWGLVAWSKGTTPALQVLGCKVWKPDSQKVAGFWWMALREVVGRIADGALSIITLLVSFVLFVTTKERRALHDLVAQTVVIHDPNKVLG